jgi:hypothetical protein
MTKKQGKRPEFKRSEVWEAKLEEIVPDSRLLDKYPSLRDIKVGYKYMIRKPHEDKKVLAGYYYKTKRILIECEDNEDFEYALKHEVDHAIKDITGGPKGGTIESNSIPGTPAWERAKKKYHHGEGEKLAFETADKPFEEYFQLPGYELQKKEPVETGRPSRRASISGLLRKLLPVFISIISFIGALFLLSPRLTGNSIAEISIKTTSWIGVILLGVSLFVGSSWLKKKS